MSVIFADTCCDLDITQVKKLNINLVDLESNDLSKSFVDSFKPYLDEEEDIIYLSSDFDKVKSDFNKSVNYLGGFYDKRIIKSVDLKSLSTCAGLVVYEAGLMYKRGCTDLEILKFVDNFKNEVYGLIITQNKEFLNKCNNQDKINKNSTLNLINPIVLTKSNNNEILDKAQGKKRAITSICNIIKTCCINIADYPLIVGYGDDQINAEYLKNSLVKELGEDAVVLIQKLSNITQEKLGKNALIVAFYSKKLKN